VCASPGSKEVATDLQDIPTPFQDTPSIATCPHHDDDDGDPRVLVLLHFLLVCHDAKLGKIDLGRRGLLPMCYAGYKPCFHSSILLACKHVFYA
jgi:hypothetical protein